MPLRLDYYISTNLPYQNKGSEVPSWNGNYSLSNWWKYGLDGMYYFYSINTNDIFIQYGYDNREWASAKFFGESLVINSEQENSDGSITANVTVKPNFFSCRKTNYASTRGFAVIYDIKINGKSVYSFNGSTIDEFTYGQGETQTFNITVNPEETSLQTLLEINVTYPNGEAPNSKTYTGLGLYNPNPPTYRPFAIRKSQSWKDLNSNKGYIMIRKSGNYVDKSEENTRTIRNENTGHNRIRKNGKNLQAPPMLNGTPQ